MLLLRALLEHRDRRPNALINENHENFFLVAKKNRAATARRSHAADLHFDNGLTHTASLAIRLHAKIRIAVRLVADQTTVSGVLEQPDVSPDLLLISWRPLHHKRAVSESWLVLLQLIVETIIKSNIEGDEISGLPSRTLPRCAKDSPLPRAMIAAAATNAPISKMCAFWL